MSYVAFDEDEVGRLSVEEALHNIAANIFGGVTFRLSGNAVHIGRYKVRVIEEGGNVILDMRDLPEGMSRTITEIMSSYNTNGRVFESIYGDNIPLDDIEPLNAGDFVPMGAEEFRDQFEKWMVECVSRTYSEKVETGFYQDSIDNIIGVIEGERDYIIWPDNLIDRNALMFHTHPDPPFTADMSISDIKIWKEMESDPSANAIVSTFGHEDIFMLSYDYKFVDDISAIDVEVEVENYIESVKRMVKHEVEVAKELDNQNMIDLDKNRYGIGTVGEIVESRVNNDQKRGEIRSVVEDGYRIEHSWELVDNR